MRGILAKGWFWALDYLYVSYRQLRDVIFRADPAAYLIADAAKPPVLILPGIYETWQFLRPLADRLSEAGHPVHVVAGLGRNARSVVDSAPIVADYLREHDLRDVTILAHSKGGLIGKYLMLLGDPEVRVTRMVAIAAPFSGSVYARLMLVPSLRAFSPRDATTLMLAANRDVNSRITSIFGSFDPHIPGGSELPGATNIRLDVAGHFRILADRRLQDAVALAVLRGVAPAPRRTVLTRAPLSQQTRPVDDSDDDQSMEQVLERLLEQFPAVPPRQVAELVDEELDSYEGEILDADEVPSEVEESARERLAELTASRPDTSPDEDSP